ncbi:MAG: hypothetical protein LW688_08815 [Cryomorphaceae bacterium]|nr:hypothetical protein [Cryomorphaceae bacterium]
MRLKNNRKAAEDALAAFSSQVAPITNVMSTADANAMPRVQALRFILNVNPSGPLADVIYSKYQAAMEVMNALRSGLITVPEGQAQVFQDLVVNLEKTWNYTDLKDAMAFVRDDANLLNYSERQVRVFPSNGFTLKVNPENAVKSGVIKAGEAKKCHKELRFNFEARGLTREQVMMLDILANNDWKRGIYFSSPGGSDVSIALYTKGYVKQNGMVFELSPLNDMTMRYAEEMYPNLISKYTYGEMSNPDVLTDYYARRHTAQYRLHFATLADDFLAKADQADRQIESNSDYMKQVPAAQVAELEIMNKDLESKSKSYREKARKLVERSLQVMPVEVVIDHGEPSQSREKYANGGVDYPAYSDGIVHDYVGMLYRAGDKKGAEQLGNKVAEQLESILNYFAQSDPYFTGNPENSGDLFAALDAYFKMYAFAADPVDGNKGGALAIRLTKNIDELYTKVFPEIYKGLKNKSVANGETSNGRYASMLSNLQSHLEAMGVHYGYLQGATPPPANNSTEQLDLESLMQQIPVGDSVNQ